MNCLTGGSAQAGGVTVNVVDVSTGTDPARDIAIDIVNGESTNLKPPVSAIKAAHATVAVVDAAGLYGVIPTLADEVAIVAMDGVEPFVTDLLEFRNAGVIAPLRADVITGAIRPAGEDEIREGLGKGAPAQLAQGQLLLDTAETTSLVAGEIQSVAAGNTGAAEK